MTGYRLAALLVGIAGVLCGAAAIPVGPFQIPAVAGAGVLILLSVGILIWAALRRKPRAITSVRDGVSVSVGTGVVIEGVLSSLGSDSLWVVREGHREVRREWTLEGEAITRRNGAFSYRFEPKATDVGKDVTLSVVRANRDADRHLRSLPADGTGQVRLLSPPPGGCSDVDSVWFRITP